ncbi:MAG: FtsX-like permease family protein [Deltaproteobacteria bacterium]|nr:FtsX-like permease family protein [Deltaproteobacteria bacterium]
MIKYILALARIAWRDTRGSRRRLLVFGLGLVLGIAALVTALAANKKVSSIIDVESRALLGSDFSLESKDPIKRDLVSTPPLAGVTREVRFRSMALFENGASLLVQVKGHDGEFPFYGAVETQPPELWSARLKDSEGILVDESLLIEAGASIGDTIKIGQSEFTLRGTVNKIASSANVSGIIAPRVYITYDAALQSGLLTRQSVADYYLHVKTADGQGALTAEKLRALLPAGVTITTSDDRRRRLGRINDNVLHFFFLVGAICLVLGAVGAGTSLYFYLRSKIPQAAMMKCLGFRSAEVAAIISLQISFIGLAAALIGSVLGCLLYWVTISILAGLYVTPVYFHIPWAAVMSGFAVGLGILLLAAAPGVLLLRRAPPLILLRGESVRLTQVERVVLIGSALLASPLLMVALTSTLKRGLLFGLALDAALLAILGLSALLKRGVIRLGRQSSSFVLRYSLLALGRPHNATTALMGAFTFSFALAGTLIIARYLLVKQVELVKSDNIANFYIYDVAPQDLHDIKSILSRHGVEVAEVVPIVLMRIKQIKGREVSELTADPNSPVPRWTLRRDYWSTYRSELLTNESLVEGNWVPRVEPGAPIPVSLEDKLAANLGVQLGDTIVFDIQGVQVPTQVASLRDIHWGQLRRNAFVVFPEGVLEEAPKFLFATAAIPDTRLAALVQREISGLYPGVSMINLRTVVDTIFEVLGQMVLGLTFITALILFTTIVVLVSTILAGRGARETETALLRTLGATRRQTAKILLLEYMIMGAAGTALGTIIALLAGYLIALYGFKIAFVVPSAALLALALAGIVTISGVAWTVGRRALGAPLHSILKAS